MSSNQAVLRLYKNLLVEASNFKSYYYKHYFTRKIRTEFRRNKAADEVTAASLIKKAEDSLAMLRRQTNMVNSYTESKLVIE